MRADFLFTQGIADASCGKQASIAQRLKFFLSKCEAFPSLSIFEILFDDFDIAALVQKSISSCPNCNLNLSYYIKASKVGEYGLFYKLASNLSPKQEFYRTLNKFNLSTVFIPSFGYVSIDDPKLYACYEENIDQCYLVFERTCVEKKDQKIFLDPAFFTERSLQKLVVYISACFELEILNYSTFCNSCKYDYPNRGPDFNINLNLIRPYLNKNHSQVLDLLEIFGCKTLFDTKVENFTKTELASFFICKNYILNDEEDAFPVLLRLLSSFSEKIRTSIFEKLSIGTKNQKEDNGYIFSFETLLKDFSISKNANLDIDKLEKISALSLVPNYKNVSSLINKKLANDDFEVVSLNGYLISSSNVALYSFFNLHPLVSKLFLMHPLAKLRGLTKKDFRINVANVNLSEDSAALYDNEEKNPRYCFDEITYQGISLNKLICMPLVDLLPFIDKLIPQRAEIIRACVEWGMGRFSLSAQLSELNLVEGVKMQFINYFFSKAKKNRIYIISDFEYLLNSAKEVKLFSSLIKKLASGKDARVILVNR